MKQLQQEKYIPTSSYLPELGVRVSLIAKSIELNEMENEVRKSEPFKILQQYCSGSRQEAIIYTFHEMIMYWQQKAARESR